jgi:uncharacterized protein
MMSYKKIVQMNVKLSSSTTRFLLLLIVANLCSPAFAASFDCNRATEAVEKMVCGNEQLSQLDTELGSAYELALGDASLNQKPERIAEQRAWISNVRDKCTDTDCLLREYSTRLQALTSIKTATTEAQYVVDQGVAASQVSRFQEQLKAVGITGSLTECGRIVRLQYGRNGEFVSRESLANPTSAAACKFNNKFVLICSNPMLNDLTLKFGYAGTGGGVADFAELNCPFSG